MQIGIPVKSCIQRVGGLSFNTNLSSANIGIALNNKSFQSKKNQDDIAFLKQQKISKYHIQKNSVESKNQLFYDTHNTHE